MKTLITIFLCLFAANVYAAPFVVSDAYPAADTQPDGFTVSVDGGAVVESAADTVAPGSVRFKFDVGSMAPGNRTLTVKAYKDYPAPFGRKESTPANFTFTSPATPSGATGLRLSQ
jgi:hypothetical protein